MNTRIKQLTSVFSVLLLVFGFSITVKANRPTDPEKTISKKQITYLSEKKAEIELDKIPRRAETIEVGDDAYKFYEGYYYIPAGEKYVRAQAPIGITVKEIPDNYQRIIMAGRVFYYSNGTFYIAKGKKAFVTVYGPVGGQVSTLPEGCQKIEINGRAYLLYHNLVFKKGTSRSRKYYEVYGYVKG